MSKFKKFIKSFFKWLWYVLCIICWPLLFTFGILYFTNIKYPKYKIIYVTTNDKQNEERNSLAAKFLKNLEINEKQQYDGTPLIATLSNSDEPYLKNNFQNKDEYAKVLYQYNLLRSQKLTKDFKTNYMLQNSNENEEKKLNKINSFEKWINIFNLENRLIDNNERYAFSSNLNKHSSIISVGLEGVGNGNILGIFRDINETTKKVKYEFLILTNNHVVIHNNFNLYNDRKGRMFISLKGYNIDLDGIYKPFTPKNEQSLYNDLSLISFEINEDEFNSKLSLNKNDLEKYFETIIPINGLNTKSKINSKDAYLSTKPFTKTNYFNNKLTYFAPEENVIVNPFKLNIDGLLTRNDDGKVDKNDLKHKVSWQNITHATIKNSFAGISGSGVYLLTKNDKGEIIPVLEGISSAGWVSKADETMIKENNGKPIDFDKLDFTFKVDENNIGLTIIRNDLSYVKKEIERFMETKRIRYRTLINMNY